MDKFGSMLHHTLAVFSQLLEVASLQEIGKCAEEILDYLKSTVLASPVATVSVVHQVFPSYSNFVSWSALTPTSQAVKTSGKNQVGIYFTSLNSFILQALELPQASESMIALKVATDVCTMCLIVTMCLNFAMNKIGLVIILLRFDVV